ncbi:MAG: FAD:protein FMN transferase [Flavobacteriales bacterium]|nr:FAD:protein FMN transferase [Flavobacteriales bacterium]
MNPWVRMLLKIKLQPIVFFFFLISLFSCSTGSKEQSTNLYKLSGQSQGTTYLIQVYDKELNFQSKQIDSILTAFDHDLSTYIESSLISRFNQIDFTDTVIELKSRFVKMLELSDSIHELSNGLFDPSVKPLIDLWGFDQTNPVVPLKSSIDSVLNFVSYKRNKHFQYNQTSDDSVKIIKKTPRFQLDFNAIAQGYSVDLLLNFINSKGHQNVYVELGGELALSGVKVNQEKWRIGVEAPIENNNTTEQVIQKVFALSDKRIATSGNYRKFFVSDGKKYAHTINPKTGRQNRHDLLSATVFSSSCALSDAYATFFMIIGLVETKAFLKSHPELGLDVFLIFDESNTYKTFLSEGAMAYLD